MKAKECAIPDDFVKAFMIENINLFANLIPFAGVRIRVDIDEEIVTQIVIDGIIGIGDAYNLEKAGFKLIELSREGRSFWVNKNSEYFY